MPGFWKHTIWEKYTRGKFAPFMPYSPPFSLYYLCSTSAGHYYAANSASSAQEPRTSQVSHSHSPSEPLRPPCGAGRSRRAPPWTARAFP